jgi:hypothetical protein
VISTSEKEKVLAAEPSPVAGKRAQLTVTGLDEKGQMFRETAAVISLNGRDCKFQSKSRPELESWVLVELKSIDDPTKARTLQGQVKSVQADGAASNLFQVQLELENAQEAKVGASPQGTSVTVPKLQPSSAPLPAVESKDTPKILRPAAGPVPQQKPGINVPAVAMADPRSGAAAAMAPVMTPQNREVGVPARAATPVSPVTPAGITQDREAMKAAAVSEAKRQLESLRSALSKEMEQMVQGAVKSNVETMAREMIEKQISASYPATVQTLKTDVAHQIVGQIVRSEELRASIQATTKKIIDEQVEASRKAMAQTQQSLDTRAGEIGRSMEESATASERRANAALQGITATLEKIQASENELQKNSETRAAEISRTVQESVALAESKANTAREAVAAAVEKVQAAMVELQKNQDSRVAELTRSLKELFAQAEGKMNTAREAVGTTLEKLQAAGNEAARSTLRLQESTEQLNQTAKSTTEKFDAHITAQLNSRSAQFKAHLDRVSGEKATQFTTDFEKQLAPHLQSAGETLEKLSAGLQLLQGTIRLQEQRSIEHSQAVTATLEKDIKAVLLRLADTK